MDAVFIDQAGYKKNFLYQYDVGQSFIIENFPYSKAPKAQFSIKSIKTSPSVGSQLENGALRVAIPDMLLTYGEDIIVYLYIEDTMLGNIIETVFISVIPRKRPAEYQYTSENFARTVNGVTISENHNIGEVAEWEDENPDRENRIGYFVTAKYGTNSLIISKSTSINTVYGVVANKVGFASNCTETKLDAAGNLLPKYEYVCTSGFVEVIDNGRCTVGGRCIPYTDGTARAANNIIGYEVIARTDAKHVIIFVDSSMNVIDGLQDSVNDLNTNLNAHKNDKSNPHETTKAQVGLSEVPNVATNDQTPTYTEATELTFLTSGEKLSVAFGKIMKAINDLIEHKNNKTNPHTIDYTKAETLEEISSQETLSTTFGKLSKAVADLIEHKGNTSNPHSVTKAQVGLGNCDNTSDINKPISTAQQTAINTVQSNLDAHKNNKTNPHEVTKAQVGLGNADNTSDIDKPVSTAQAAEITRVEGLVNDAQGDIDTHSARTDNPHAVTKGQVGLGNCDNTSDVDKPISTATQTALDKKADLDDNGLVPLSQLPSQVKEMRVVNTIADRDAITDKFENLRVYVKDATADSTVKSGGADYLYDGSSWIKTSEAESLDLVLSWDNVSDVPTDYTPSAHASTHFTGGSDAITPSDIGADVSGSAAAVQTNLDNHVGDSTIHVTADEKEKWNESDVFIAEYGVTTNAEIEAAKQAGKAIYAVYQKIMFSFYGQGNETNHVFRSVDSDWCSSLYCNNNRWYSVSSKYTPNTHASTHASGGSDPITPESIGAKSITDRDVFIAEYGVTTNAEIVAAIVANNAVFCRYNADDGTAYVVPLESFQGDSDCIFRTGSNSSILTIRCKSDIWNAQFSAGYTPVKHATVHNINGSDPISPADIGAVAQSDFETLQNKVNNLSITDFILTDATTGTQYTLGVDNGVIVLNEVQ